MSILKELLMAEETTKHAEESTFAPLVEEVVSEKVQQVPSIEPVVKAVLQLVYEEYADKMDPKALTALLFEAADIALLAIGMYDEYLQGRNGALLEANTTPNLSELKNELNQLHQQIQQYAEKLHQAKTDAEVNQIQRELASIKEKYAQLRKEYEEALKHSEPQSNPQSKEDLSLLDKIKHELDHLKQQAEHVAQHLAKEIQQGAQHVGQTIQHGVQQASQFAHEHPYAAAGAGAAAGVAAAYGLYKLGKKLYKKIKNR
jgi:ElaB/YqjD/DUF883 family membrane-anchored ribosome-binding protein/predicted transcriptional regulator